MRSAAMKPTPNFYLYGEPHRRVEDGFVHVESLDDRSRPSEWTIAAHSHAELAHIFYLSAGGGQILAEEDRLPCNAPCLLLIPATIVHGFDWEDETAGSVITLATRRLSGLTWFAPETAGLLTRVDVIALPEEAAAKVERSIDDLMLELSWARIGHDAALQAYLLAILVSALRHRGKSANWSMAEAKQRSMVARMRERIEERFRLREPVSTFAAALNMSETALRLACTKVTGSTPAAMLDQRTLLEARRSLLFSDLSISEIAYLLGFEDAAYFSRFF